MERVNISDQFQNLLTVQQIWLTGSKVTMSDEENNAYEIRKMPYFFGYSFSDEIWKRKTFEKLKKNEAKTADIVWLDGTKSNEWQCVKQSALRRG